MSVDVKEISWQEWAVGGGAALLAIDLLVLPWWSVGFGYFSVSETGLGAPDGFLGILAFLGAVGLAGYVVIARFTSVKLPELAIPWSRVVLIAALCVAALVGLKFVLHPHISYLSIGAWLALALGAIVIVGSIASTTSSAPTTSSTVPPSSEQASEGS